MTPGMPDTPLLALVLQRGLLSEAGLASLHTPGLETQTASPEPRYGPSIDRLIRAGHLEEGLVRTLLAELTALADTRDGLQSPPARDPPAALPATPGAGGTPDEERYVVRRLLGQGGMGSVYEAWDSALGRTVALKLLHGRDERATLRLLREARAQARVRHPHVCEVYDTGVRAGQPYVAMAYLAGQPLHVAGPHLTLREKVHVTRQIAEALEAAHRLGIVHRDVKPANVMVERQGDGPLRATMMDFGLARGPGEGEHVSMTGAVLGTPAYMPPEQVRGDARPGDGRADVYGLGALLYHLLVGEPPFSGATVEQILLRVVHEEPIAPRRKCPSIPEELETLLLTCMRKDVGERYASAQAVAEDLGRYLAGRPLLARGTSWSARASTWARRHRGGVALVVLLALGAGGVWAGAVHAQRQSERRARLAQRLGQQVEASELFLRAAYALPAHDVRREEAFVRARMEGIATELAELSGLEAALAHYALGRAHLALREEEPAVRHLQAALEGGLGDSEVHLALGRALGARYDRARQDLERLGDKRALEARLGELDATWLAPAREQLRQGLEQGPEPRPYDEGLLALYSQRHDVARRKAEEAQQREEWSAEARKLAADSAFFQGLHHQWRGEHDAARAAYQSAEALYATASDMARSDVSIPLAQARLWSQGMVLDMFQGRSPGLAAERLLEACARARLIAPGGALVHDFEYSAFITLARYEEEHGAEPSARIEAAITAARRAVELTPGEVVRQTRLAEALLARALHELRRGGAVGTSLALAEAQALEAARLHPDSPWAWSTLGNVRATQAFVSSEQGGDASPRMQEALAAYEKALGLDPGFTSVYENLARLYRGLARHELEQGRPLDALRDRAVRVLNEAIERFPGNPLFYRYRGALSASWAESLLLTGGEPGNLLEAARADMTMALTLKPDDTESHLERARVHRLFAGLEARAGRAPAPWLAEALDEADKAVHLDPENGECRLEQARVWMLLAREEVRRGHSPVALLDKAREALATVHGPPSRWADAQVLLAELSLVRAGAAFRGTSDGQQAVSEGLAHVERALRSRPGMPRALLVQGSLWSRAARTRPVAERRLLLRRARACLEEALDGHPLMRQELDEALEEVRRGESQLP